MADSADRLFSDAIACQTAGFPGQALEIYRHVVALTPSAAALYVNQALAWLARPKGDDGGETFARTAARRAIRLAPRSPDSHTVAGDVARDSGLSDAAQTAYCTALVLAPGHVGALNNLGTLLTALNDTAAATRILRRAVRRAPEHAPPHANLAALLLQAEHIEESIASARRSMALDPGASETMNNLGNALVEANRTDEAARWFRHAIAIRPDFAQACLNLSGALIDLGDTEAGAALCRRAIASQPGNADSYNNLANARLISGDLGGAGGMFRRALALAPDEARSHYNHAAVLLKQGHYADGWSEYEWRLKTKDALKYHEVYTPPTWDGGPLGGRTIVVWAEQGLGDVLQFCRYAPRLAAQGATVVLRVYPPLLRLLGRLDGVDSVVADDQPLPPCDCQISLMSLPHRLSTRLDSIPAEVPYLSADPLAAVLWKHRLAGLPGLKVGLVWAGDPRPSQRGAHLLDRRRSLPLAAFDRLGRIDGVSLISLQKGPPAAQRENSRLEMFDAGPELADFADTAALIATLDLVISVDTAVAHLAGALAKEVWILSRYDGCWRWLDGRDDSPWYPSARLFRQSSPGDWAPVIERVCHALTLRVATYTGG